MSDFVFDPDQWAKRADVAREAAEELGRLANSLRGVVRENVFGRGCDEGEALFSGLTAMVTAGVDDLESLQGAARLLANSLADGSGRLTNGDADAGLHFA